MAVVRPSPPGAGRKYGGSGGDSVGGDPDGDGGGWVRGDPCDLSPNHRVEARRESGLPASPAEGTHGSPSWSELSRSGGDAARPKVEQPLVGREVEEVETPYPSEAVIGVEPSTPSQELAVVRSLAGPSDELGATTDLVWPCPGDPRKVRFILQDEEEL